MKQTTETTKELDQDFDANPSVVENVGAWLLAAPGAVYNLASDSMSSFYTWATSSLFTSTDDNRQNNNDRVLPSAYARGLVEQNRALINQADQANNAPLPPSAYARRLVEESQAAEQDAIAQLESVERSANRL